MILKREEIAPNIFEMVVEHPRLAAKAQPGHFVIVMADESGERIPLTVADFDRSIITNMADAPITTRSITTNATTRIPEPRFVLLTGAGFDVNVTAGFSTTGVCSCVLAAGTMIACPHC